MDVFSTYAASAMAAVSLVVSRSNSKGAPKSQICCVPYGRFNPNEATNAESCPFSAWASRRTPAYQTDEAFPTCICILIFAKISSRPAGSVLAVHPRTGQTSK